LSLIVIGVPIALGIRIIVPIIPEIVDLPDVVAPERSDRSSRLT
jgi:hypothetical protein